jgi:ubiquinone/menaquinone biosynthesis C-methylase UbiE
MSTTSATSRPPDLTPELKARHRAMWALGDYADVAEHVVGGAGAALVEACDVQPGERVLDVAAGSGNAAIPAALRGAHVVASDLTPELLDRGRGYAAAAAAQLTWEEADAEALPHEDGAFDLVMSSLGVMFAPHHQRAADELVRVTRPGGRIGLLSWTPQGFIGQMFALMKDYVAAPPAGVSPPPLWGDEDHVRTLLGDRVARVHARRASLRIERFGTGEEFREYFKASYGPTIAAYAGLKDDPARTAELDAGLTDLARRHDLGSGAMDWEYLLLTATRR